MRNVWELVAVVGAVILLALCFLLVFQAHPGPSRRSSCNSNLGQIVKACTTYQEPNGDFFPAYWDGDRFDPMKSLAKLYPQYINNPKVFGCPSTKDRPVITVTVAGEFERRCAFGPVDTDRKCSYFYDELSHFRAIGPGQAMAADADGQTWLDANGKAPPYPSTGWTRRPQKPNHEDGQNVMYFDGHVRWQATVHGSTDPKDNIFCPNASKTGPWGADTDACLWDGVNARVIEIVE